MNAHTKIEEKSQPIKGYESRYSIDEFGNIFSIKSGKYLKWQMGPKSAPYAQVNLSKGSRKEQKTFTIHRLVAETFLIKPIGDVEVNHKDGNRWNNHISNLEWVSKSENALHAFNVIKTRVPPGLKGEDNGRAKLTEFDVLAIRQDRIAGLLYREIGEKYGITEQQAGYICRGKSWSHVPMNQSQSQRDFPNEETPVSCDKENKPSAIWVKN